MTSFETPEPITVNVTIGVGDLRIVASDRADTLVHVQPSDPANPDDVKTAERTTVAYTNGVLEIRAPKNWKRYSFRGGAESIDVLIELPTNSRVNAEAVLAALRCSGTLGECRCKTGNDISLERVEGLVDLKTSTGAIRVDAIGTTAHVKNGNGDTWIGEVAGDLQVKSANGAIRIDRAGASAMAKTANGDIHFAEVAEGTIVAETACGKVDIAVRPGRAAWLDLHTGFGHVHNLLEAGERPEPSEKTVTIRARSSFGDITIRHADIADTDRGAA